MNNYGILGIIVLAIDIYAVLNVAGASATIGQKVAWIVGIVVFPILGAIVWYFAGPRSGGPARLD